MKRFFKRSKYAYRLTATDWSNALFWLLLSVVVFSVSLPINVLKFEVFTASEIFFVTIFRSFFTAVFVGIPAAIVYYGSFVSAPPSAYKYVLKQVVVNVPLVAYSFLYTAIFVALLAITGLFWTNAIYDIVPSIAALISLLFVSSRFTKMGVLDNILEPNEVNRYEKFLSGYKESTQWLKRLVGLDRRDQAQRVKMLFVSTLVGVTLVTFFFQVVVGYISPSQGVSDTLNAFLLTPTLLVWYMFRALAKRRRSITFLRTHPSNKKGFKVRTVFVPPLGGMPITAPKEVRKRV